MHAIPSTHVDYLHDSPPEPEGHITGTIARGDGPQLHPRDDLIPAIPPLPHLRLSSFHPLPRELRTAIIAIVQADGGPRAMQSVLATSSDLRSLAIEPGAIQRACTVQRRLARVAAEVAKEAVNSQDNELMFLCAGWLDHITAPAGHPLIMDLERMAQLYDSDSSDTASGESLLSHVFREPEESVLVLALFWGLALFAISATLLPTSADRISLARLNGLERRARVAEILERPVSALGSEMQLAQEIRMLGRQLVDLDEDSVSHLIGIAEGFSTKNKAIALQGLIEGGRAMAIAAVPLS